MQNNSTGSYNTAAGYQALQGSATASDNTGSSDTAVGSAALQSNTTGGDNTAIGQNALQNNTTGSNNIGIGFQAGSNLTTGNNNIDIGSGNESVAGESNTIRIGSVNTQNATFIAGIYENKVNSKKHCAVLVDLDGRLGCGTSKNVDAVDDTSMLFNEVQKQARADQRITHQLARKDAQIAALQRQVAALQKKSSEIDAMAERLNALERQARVSRPERLAAALR
ncbi:MAG: hypothetical protein ACLP0B_08955 [Steroidobacteraceae bacterium]